jgi:beta-1,2-mannobiose phosphorylase / 1,2-beta-oligomannan phosphorylase
VLSPKERSSSDPEGLENLAVRVDRLGIVTMPDGTPDEVGGILNPAATRAPGGELLLYPRCVAEGNISRVGTMRTQQEADGFRCERLDFALQPEAPYEVRPRPGYGCEDPRVTYVPQLEAYVMAYTAFGPDGPRIAVALSKDAYHWERLGPVRFAGSANVVGDDKDAAFFPEPVLSPEGRKSLAFYHRPMLHLSSVDGRAAIPMIERMPFEDRESIRIGYVPFEPVLKNRKNLCKVAESRQVLSPDAAWGSIKIGAGTPPVKIALDGTEMWLSLFHGVDSVGNGARKPSLQYRAGIVLQDLERPDKILYRSPKPILAPEMKEERKGVVDNVVFPTGLDPRPDLGEHVYDIYYGMSDYAIGAARMTIETPKA